MRATTGNGDLIDIPNCYIDTPYGRIRHNILPEVSDSKSAKYSDEPIIGRSFPLKTYSYSENRVISWTSHFAILKAGDEAEIIYYKRLVESLCYPRTENTKGAPYAPPPICKLRHSDMLGDQDICAVLVDYSIKYPTDVVWYEGKELDRSNQAGGTSGGGSNGETSFLIPIKLDIDMKWEAVYESNSLPGQSRIMRSGR